MWLNESIAAQFGLNIINTPRSDFEGWARIALPEFDNRYNHPYCKQVESVLIRALGRGLGNLSSMGKVNTVKYSWRGGQLYLEPDFSPNMLDLTDEGGTNFIGGYKAPAVYSPPCIGVAERRQNHELVPVFLNDKQLAEGYDYDRDSAVFFRTRDLDTDDFRSAIKAQLLRRLNSRNS
jgi:hypothetical protein